MTYAERSVELLKKLIVIDSSQPEGNEDKIVNHYSGPHLEDQWEC